MQDEQVAQGGYCLNDGCLQRYEIRYISMLSDTLVTNEVKNAAGTEVEFTRLSISNGTTEFAKINESPAYPHRLKISHSSSGSGTAKRRRSVVRFDLHTQGDIDTTTTVRTSAYVVLDAPIGNMSDNADSQAVLANLMSFCASLGASTTILYDCTGNGAAALLTSGL